ncbi:MAG: hypothetical protein ACT4N4_10180 [Rhodospirillales bacterium]
MEASIATYTAVAVVNLTMAPPLARWLLPTAIGTAGIAWVTRKYRLLFAQGKKARDVATVRIGGAEEYTSGIDAPVAFAAICGVVHLRIARACTSPAISPRATHKPWRG